MRIRLLEKSIVGLALLFSAPLARGETARVVRHLSSVDASGNFTDWTPTQFYDGYRNRDGFMISDIDLKDAQNPTIRFANKYLETQTIQQVFIKTATRNTWQRLTTDKGFTIIPREATSIGFWTVDKRGSGYIVIADLPENEETIKIEDLDVTIIKGIQNEDRNCIKAGEDKVIEVALTHKDLPTLTQAYGDFDYRLSGDEKCEIIAKTPSGDQSLTATISYSSTTRAFIPAGTTEIRLKFSNIDKLNYIANKTDFCKAIVQEGNNGKYSPEKENFSSIPSNSALYYDVDSDGIKEWAYGYLYRLNYDLLGYASISDRFPSIDQWINYGRNDIDAISGKTILAIDSLQASTLLTTNGNLSVIDYNNDGQDDFLVNEYGTDGKVITLGHNGNFRTEYRSTVIPFDGRPNGVYIVVADGTSTQTARFVKH
ncbi:MAG: hypothetical protein NC411_01545 [Bacteroides sp.]|nr:hypothetical protein [Bacteroides sp.]